MDLAAEQAAVKRFGLCSMLDINKSFVILNLEYFMLISLNSTK